MITETANEAVKKLKYMPIARMYVHMYVCMDVVYP